MNRNSSIRNLGLAVILFASALALGGCAGQSTDEGSSNEPGRKAHLVGVQGTNDDGREGVLMNVEHALIDTDHAPVHPATGTNLGPRPEPWMDEGGDTSGPRPEPWTTDSNDNNSGSPPPSGNGGTGSSGGSTGGGSGGSSGGNPANK